MVLTKGLWIKLLTKHQKMYNLWFWTDVQYIIQIFLFFFLFSFFKKSIVPVFCCQVPRFGIFEVKKNHNGSGFEDNTPTSCTIPTATMSPIPLASIHVRCSCNGERMKIMLLRGKSLHTAVFIREERGSKCAHTRQTTGWVRGWESNESEENTRQPPSLIKQRGNQ